MSSKLEKYFWIAVFATLITLVGINAFAQSVDSSKSFTADSTQWKEVIDWVVNHAVKTWNGIAGKYNGDNIDYRTANDLYVTRGLITIDSSNRILSGAVGVEYKPFERIGPNVGINWLSDTQYPIDVKTAVIPVEFGKGKPEYWKFLIAGRGNFNLFSGTPVQTKENVTVSK